MKDFRFKPLVALILIMCCTLGYAQRFEIDGLKYKVVDESKRYVEVVDGPNTKTVKIPTTITRGGVKYTVKSIGKKAFEDCYNLTSITIPSSVTNIGEMAFRYCSNLTSITIPRSVTSIEDWAFLGCESLTSITLPKHIKNVHNLYNRQPKNRGAK